MPSFASRRFSPDRLRSLSKEDLTMEEDTIIPVGRRHTPGHKRTTTSSPLALAPSDGGSLLDYFDLPSPPSTPHRSTHSSLSYSSLNSFPSPATSSPSLTRRNSTTTSTPSSPPTPPTSTPFRWPTASQRLHHSLPSRPRSRSVSSTSTTSSSGSDDPMAPIIRHARRTPYYPPNASRSTADRSRVYMNRGPHFVQNWTPMGSLPRHVQLQIEERMVRFTAL